MGFPYDTTKQVRRPIPALRPGQGTHFPAVRSAISSCSSVLLARDTLRKEFAQNLQPRLLRGGGMLLRNLYGRAPENVKIRQFAHALFLPDGKLQGA